MNDGFPEVYITVAASGGDDDDDDDGDGDDKDEVQRAGRQCTMYIFIPKMRGGVKGVAE